VIIFAHDARLNVANAESEGALFKAESEGLARNVGERRHDGA